MKHDNKVKSQNSKVKSGIWNLESGTLNYIEFRAINPMWFMV